jgi:hypothetical protein
LLKTEIWNLKKWRELLKFFETAMLFELHRHVHIALENTPEEKLLWGKKLMSRVKRSSYC